MRQFYALTVLLVVAAPLSGLQEEPVKCTVDAIHLSSKSCEKTLQDLLAKVKGVSGIAVDRPAKSVSFTAKTGKVADEAVEALLNGGFYGKLTLGKAQVDVTSEAMGFQADRIVVRNVHACCEDCDKAIKVLFKDAKVTLQGNGPQKDVTIEGKQLDADQVLRTLHTAGLHGVIDTKKK
jgi:hypothetical protein